MKLNIMKCIVSIKSLQNNPYFHNKAKSIFSEVVYLENRPIKPEELIPIMGQCDVLIIGAKEKILSNVVSNSPVMPKIIGTLSVGLDHLDLIGLKQKDVTVINSPTANVLSVAEHIMAVALSLTKRLVEGNISVSENKGRAGLSSMPIELNDKTLGLIGYGKISKALAKISSCFGMKIIATSQTRTSGNDKLISFTDLDSLLSKSDVISINVPLNDSTKNLINSSNIGIIKNGAILINTSREEITDFDCIYDSLLTDNGLSGFGIDADDIPTSLSKLHSVVATPHIAGLSNEASDRLDNELIDRIEDFIN